MSTKTTSLSQEQFERIKNLNLTEKENFVFNLIYYTGLRVSDIVKMKWTDFDNIKNVIRIKMQKTQNFVEIIFTPALKKLVEQYRLNQDFKNEYVLTSRHHYEPMTRQGINFILNNIVKKYEENFGEKIQLAPHSLRKTLACNVYKKSNNNIEITRRVLGHKNINSTVAYLSNALIDQEYKDIMNSIGV